MKATRLYDCFTFFNELDLLELRLNELADVVDVHVIVEARTTFQGDPKPLCFAENKERFADHLDRIRHVVVDLPGLDEASLGSATRRELRRLAFEREAYQREAIRIGLDEASPDDLILLSDVDEIVRPAVLERAMVEAGLGVGCFELRHFNYYLNFELPRRMLHHGPRLARRRLVRSMQALRRVSASSDSRLTDATRMLRSSWQMRRPIRRSIYRDAGWHFSSLGTSKDVIEKLQAYSHVGRSDTVASVDQRIKNGIAISSRATDGEDDRLVYREIDGTFPSYLQSNLARFRHLIAEAPPAGDDGMPLG